MDESRRVLMGPRRRRRWRWLPVGFLVVCGLVAGAPALWGWRADRALQARIAELQSQGFRVIPSDFAPPPGQPDPPDNAARDLTAAAAIVDDDSPESTTIAHVPTTMPINPKAWPYLERAAAYYEPALRRIERAQSKPTLQWDQNFRSPVMEHVRLNYLNGNLELARLVKTAALVEHHRGADDAVVRRFEQLLFLADACSRTPFVSGYRCAAGIQLGTATRIEQIAPNLKIGDAAGAARASHIHKLIKLLLDDAALNSGLRMGLQGDSMMMRDMVESLARGAPSYNTQLPAIARYFAEPHMVECVLTMLDHDVAIVRAIDGAQDWPVARTRVDAIQPLKEQQFFLHDSLSISRLCVEDHFMALTDRRLAATALAIRLYQHDHAGKPPDRLEQLVPQYLPAVPIDPMASPSRAIGYRVAAEHPVLYSVGKNGNDDSASEAPQPNRYGELDEWDRLDRVFYLTSRPREVVYIPRPNPNGAIAGYAAGIDEPAPWERE